MRMDGILLISSPMLLQYALPKTVSSWKVIRVLASEGVSISAILAVPEL